MKATIMAICLGVTVGACSSSKTQNAGETSMTAAEQLINRLDTTAASGKFFFGHHDDTAYGHDWKYQEGRSDVRDITGEYPGLMNWDLGMLELDSVRNLDGVPFGFISEEIIAQDARGGINAISWHPRNPLSGGDSWDVSSSPLHDISNNQALSDTIDSWIAKAAEFIGSLKDSEGNHVPVIFRPWHENTGTWFWWGSANSTPEEYKDLWKRTRRIFDEKGIENVVWAYSPDKGLTAEDYFTTYPGDEYVDVLGSDIYHFGGNDGTEQFREMATRQLNFIAGEAKKRGKIAAFTETGLEGVTIDNWYTEILMPIVSEIPLAYICVWRNANESDKPGHFYVPYPGHPAENDFKIFHDNDKTIFVK